MHAMYIGFRKILQSFVMHRDTLAREFAINGVSTVPASGRGLTLIKFEKNGNILFNQCFDIYNNTTENIDSFIS